VRADHGDQFDLPVHVAVRQAKLVLWSHDARRELGEHHRSCREVVAGFPRVLGVVQPDGEHLPRMRARRADVLVGEPSRIAHDRNRPVLDVCPGPELRPPVEDRRWAGAEPAAARLEDVDGLLAVRHNGTSGDVCDPHVSLHSLCGGWIAAEAVRGNYSEIT
jgi:hypothetical protein